MVSSTKTEEKMNKKLLSLVLVASLVLGAFATAEAGKKICVKKHCKKIGRFIKICYVVVTPCPRLVAHVN